MLLDVYIPQTERTVIHYYSDIPFNDIMYSIEELPCVRVAILEDDGKHLIVYGTEKPSVVDVEVRNVLREYHYA